jgi:GNAT superfamily N-acetyltransferase
MKITEIITEGGVLGRYIENKLIKYDDQLSLDVKVDGQTVDIRAIVDGKQVGYVVFDRDGKTLIAGDLAVDREYRRQGIATKMYDYVKSLGFTVKRSDNQLSRGKLFWDKSRGEGANVWEQEDPIDEMALAKYQTFGDFNKPGPFTGVDKKLVPHPKNIQKATTFFEQTPYDFRLFFANISGLGKYRETGPVSPEQLRQIFNKEQADEIINDSEDAITVIYVSNVGDRKVMMTPWIMAHRFGHAIQAGARQNRTWNAWTEVERHFFSQINQILVNDYGKQAGAATRRVNTDDALRQALSTEYNALFNAIGTQRSSRERQINRPYEFMYEMFAQYLKTGTVTLNPLPDRIPYGKMVFGRASQYLTLNPEVRNDPNTKYITDTLGNDIAILFGDVLSSAVGKIYVM